VRDKHYGKGMRLFTIGGGVGTSKKITCTSCGKEQSVAVKKEETAV
jgi:hypothetical protein